MLICINLSIGPAWNIIQEIITARRVGRIYGYSFSYTTWLECIDAFSIWYFIGFFCSMDFFGNMLFARLAGGKKNLNVGSFLGH